MHFVNTLFILTFWQKICISEMILRAAKKLFKVHMRQGNHYYVLQSVPQKSDTIEIILLLLNPGFHAPGN